MIPKGRGALALLALVAALVAAMPAAAAKVVEVPATPVAEFGNSSTEACQAVYFLQWREVEDGASWRAEYKFNGRPRTKTTAPPFDDRTYAERGWVAPAGSHWVEIGSSARLGLGGQPQDCSDLPGKVLPGITDAKVLVTLKEDAKIVGTVKDVDGDPVKGVRVTAPGAGSDRTDADGEYEIDAPERTRTYTVTPRLRGEEFTPKRRRVTVRAGQTKRANFRMRYERAIAGRVRLACAGQSACKVLPVKDVKVSVSRIGKGSGPRRYTATTDEDGRYKLRVRKGRYRVRTTNAVTGISPARRTLDVTRRKRAKGDFVACTLRPRSPRGGALLNAVGGGTWTTARTCAHRVEVNWAPAAGRVSFTWGGVPICRNVKNGITGGDEFALNQARWVAGPAFVRIDPNEGHRMINAGDRITFEYRIRQMSDPLAFAIPFSGVILANGTGSVSGDYTTPIGTNLLCRFAMKDVPIARG